MFSMSWDKFVLRVLEQNSYRTNQNTYRTKVGVLEQILGEGVPPTLIFKGDSYQNQSITSSTTVSISSYCTYCIEEERPLLQLWHQFSIEKDERQGRDQGLWLLAFMRDKMGHLC